MTLKNQAIQTALEGNWQDAIAINKTLIGENSQDIDALNRLALAYTITGQIKHARSAYQKVLNIDKLNPIAIRNLKKLKDKNAQDSNGTISTIHLINNFLEEPGKTKIVELVNIAEPKIIEVLRTGQTVELSIKRLKIFVLEEKKYIGVLPDDIGKRLIKFINSGCIYQAYVKSNSPHKVTIFIKETKKTGRFKTQSSFLTVSDSPLALDKNGKIKARVENQRSKVSEDDDDKNEIADED